MEKFDVIIIGAGPAGLAAAKVLGESDKRVLVLEKSQKIGQKICAGGLTLKDFGLGIPINLAEQIFHSIRINYSDKVFETKRTKPFVVTISREKLGQWQLQQIKKNVEIRMNSEVVEIKNESILLKQKEEIRFNYLIGADGSLSRVRRYLSLPPKKIWLSMQYIIPKIFSELEVFFDQNLFGPGYAWIFPHKDYTSIGCGSEAKFQNLAGLSKNFHQWLETKKIDYNKSQFQTAFINFDYQGFNFGNKFLIGDAGGFASGLTGEGIYFAIISGQEIAKKILDPNYNLIRLKKILKIKKYQETWGKFLLFKTLRIKPLTQFLFKRYV
jgi:geranylgeranyl reductase